MHRLEFTLPVIKILGATERRKMLDYETFVKSEDSESSSTSFMSLATPFIRESQRMLFNRSSSVLALNTQIFPSDTIQHLDFGAVTPKQSQSLALKEKLGVTPYPPVSAHLPEGYRLTDCQFRLGERVVVDKEDPKKIRHGTLRFYGKVQFQEGLWAGIECDKSIGKNDGSVDG